MSAPSLTQLLIGLFGFSGETNPQKEQSPADTGLCEKEENSTMVIRSDINGKAHNVALTHAARTSVEAERPALGSELPDGTPYKFVPTWGKACPWRYSEYLLVTPEIATLMLATNTRNRSLNRKDVNKYATRMINNKWETTHQGIAFDKSGTLADGQHRLTAIVTTGVAVVLLVLWNQPRVGGPIDDGRKRSNVDRSNIDEPEISKEALRNRHEICNVLVQIENGSLCEVDQDAADEKYAQFKREIDWMLGYGRIRHINAATRAAFAYAYGVNPEKTRDAWDRFIDGVGLEKDSPIYTLREQIGPRMNDKSGPSAGRYASRLSVFRRVTRALMAHIQNKKLKRLHDNSDGHDWMVAQRKAKDLPA